MNPGLPRGLPPETAFSGVSIDSRKVREGDLFIALKGDRHDGHDFVGEALRNGAMAAVVDAGWLAAQKRRQTRGGPVIPVPDTLEALQSLARYHRRRLGIPVVAITGTNGKTTTKEMTAAVLAMRFRVLRSEGSFNNHIGVPLTLLRMRRTHEVAVLEMGMNHRGELTRLCEIAEPTAGVVTNVGAAHLEFLGSLEEVGRAKAELIKAIGPDGFVVLNADDPRVLAMRQHTAGRVHTFGIREGADVRGVDLQLVEGAYARFKLGPEWIRLNVPGRHNASNALAAAAVGRAMGCTPSQIREGLESYHGTKWRGELIRSNGITILNDAYNANPVSAEKALELLRDWTNGTDHRRVAVLGDMLELGHVSEAAHRALGEKAASSGVELLVGVGAFAAEVARGATDAGFDASRIRTGSDVEEAWRVLEPELSPGDLVLLKGSRGVGLERMAELITGGARGGTPLEEEEDR